MSEAELSVSFAGPLVTVQDGGRPGYMRFGVPASGPMDRLAFDAAHAALGNAPGQAALEVSLGGLVLHCTSGAVSVAVTGGDFVVEHAGRQTRSWTVLTLEPGQRVTVRAGTTGSWAYLAFAGTLQADDWLGSKATHSISGFGGGAVLSGQVLRIAGAELREDRLGEIAKPAIGSDGPIRVVIGPQDHNFAEGALDQFLSSPFRVTDAYDRMGMRLDGPRLELDGALSIPSEPILRGAVQVSGDGVPTVLLADHQTTGGYPKIATVIACDTDRLSQLRSGDVVRFAAVSPQQAIEAVRAHSAHRTQYLQNIAIARGRLSERLMRENLISAWGP